MLKSCHFRDSRVSGSANPASASVYDNVKVITIMMIIIIVMMIIIIIMMIMMIIIIIMMIMMILLIIIMKFIIFRPQENPGGYNHSVISE